MIKYLFEIYNDYDIDMIFNNAVYSGNVELLEWLDEKNLFTKNSESYETVLESYDFDDNEKIILLTWMDNHNFPQDIFDREMVFHSNSLIKYNEINTINYVLNKFKNIIIKKSTLILIIDEGNYELFIKLFPYHEKDININKLKQHFNKMVHDENISEGLSKIKEYLRNF